jgi:hypothetical protein
MERVKRVRMLVVRAMDAVQRGGEPQATLRVLQEALDLLRKIEGDISRFRDQLASTPIDAG